MNSEQFRLVFWKVMVKGVVLVGSLVVLTFLVISGFVHMATDVIKYFGR